MKTNNRAWCLFFMFLMLVSACGGKPLQVSYYNLATIDGLEYQAGAVATMSDLSIGIGPVGVPEKLTRSQILTRVGDNRVTYSESHRWAGGDIEKNISGTIRENISLLLGTERVDVFPWAPVFLPTYRIVLEIIEFDGIRGENANLNVRWSIYDGTGKNLLVVKKTVIREPTGGDTYDDLVKAQSKTLAALSREICEEIVRLEKTGAGKERVSDKRIDL